MTLLILDRFDLTVLYGQIFVSRPGEGGYPLWTQAHVDQGFAWREACVAFGIPDHDGDCRVEVGRGPPPPLEGDCLRAIEVPYLVPPGGVEVGGLAGQRVVAMPPGPHQIRFDLSPEAAGPGLRVRLLLTPGAPRRFAILRRDAEMTTDTVLTTTAEEAR
jgi:hypothetical protein